MDTMESQDTIRRIYQALQTGDLSVFSASVHFGRSSNGSFSPGRSKMPFLSLGID